LYALSDPIAEEMFYDSEAMRRFAGIELAMIASRTKPPSLTSGTCW